MKFIDPRHDAWLSADATRTHRLLDVAEWQLLRARGNGAAALRPGKTGLLLPNEFNVESLDRELGGIDLIALQFPKWTDGRAYSQARLLRSRLRYAGELRAVGEVLVDMLPLLQRTGFDAVVLRDDQSLDSAQRALRFFAGHYQGDVIETRPHFNRPTADAVTSGSAA